MIDGTLHTGRDSESNVLSCITNDPSVSETTPEISVNEGKSGANILELTMER